MRIIPPLTSLALTATIAVACSQGFPETGFQKLQRAETELIGLSEDQLLACAGPPVWRMSHGSIETLFFERAFSAQTPLAPTAPESSPWLHLASTLDSGGDNPVLCEARVTLRDGTVTGIRFKETNGGSLENLCTAIIDDCLGPRP